MNSTTDCLHLCGIKGYGYTGLLPEEQILGQWFEVDLYIYLDLRRAGQSDSISDTYDYRQAIDQVRTLLRQSHFALVERLATAIAEAVLAHADVESVRVCLTKVAPPIPDFGGSIQVELVRSKGA
ncbi:MAG: dihydroneopterin aldolase [Thermosynechococcaceae cyanobacterium]